MMIVSHYFSPRVEHEPAQLLPYQKLAAATAGLRDVDMTAPDAVCVDFAMALFIACFADASRCRSSSGEWPVKWAAAAACVLLSSTSRVDDD